MDTKLKKFIHSIIIKIILFVLIVASFSLLISGLLKDELRTDHSIVSVLNNDNFYESQLLNSRIYSDLHRIQELIELNEKLLKMKNVDSLSNQDYFSKERMYNKAIELYNLESIDELDTLDEESLNNLKNSLVSEDINQIERDLLNQSDARDFKYYLKNGLVELSNTDYSNADYYKDSKLHMISSQNETLIQPDAFNSNAYGFTHTFNNIKEKTDVFYLSFPDDLLKSLEKDYALTKNIAENRLKKSIIYLLIAISALLLLMIIIGKNGVDEDLHMKFIDKLYTDINLVVLSIIIVIYIIIMSEFIRMGFEEMNYYIPMTGFAITIALLLVLSIIKHLKNRTLIKHSLTYSILDKVFSGINSIFKMGNIGVRIILLLAIYTFVVLFSVLFYPLTFIIVPFFFILLLWTINIKGINELKTGIKKIREGILDYKIEINRKGEIRKFAEEVNRISEGLRNALMNEVRSEKLKTELITNVSHDLRTPLTSIITYVDLLKKEKDQEKQRKYIEVIDQKSNRLKLLTDDLFEMTKLNSGNIQTDKSKIDLVDLINQGLGEYENSIEKSGLEFKLNVPADDHIYVNADGNLNLTFNR